MGAVVGSVTGAVVVDGAVAGSVAVLEGPVTVPEGAVVWLEGTVVDGSVTVAVGSVSWLEGSVVSPEESVAEGSVVPDPVGAVDSKGLVPVGTVVEFGPVEGGWEDSSDCSITSKSARPYPKPLKISTATRHNINILKDTFPIKIASLDGFSLL